MTASLRDAAQMALDVFREMRRFGNAEAILRAGIAASALRAAMALPDETVAAPGPAGWVDAGNWTRADWIAYMDANQWGECATPQPAPVEQKPLTEIDWQAVGRIIETNSRLRGLHTVGTSNWGAAIWKAAHGIKGAA